MAAVHSHVGGGSSARLRVGLIVPPAHGRVPPEARVMYPDIDWRATGLGVRELGEAGFDAVLDQVIVAAHHIADGAAAIALMGTSLSFYRGVNGHDDMLATIRRVTGLPAVSMSEAILADLRAAGIRQLAVATAYTDQLNDRLAHFLTAHGFAPQSMHGLGVVHGAELRDLRTDDIVRIGAAALRDAPSADGLLISCGGLRAMSAIDVLQQQFGVPVVSSATAGPRAAVNLARRSVGRGVQGGAA